MICMKCKHRIPNDSEFCQYCGASLDKNLGLCNAENKECKDKSNEVQPENFGVCSDGQANSIDETKSVIKKKTPHKRFCRRCGGEISAHNKCKSCGKQYSGFKKALVVGLATLLLISGSTAAALFIVSPALDYNKAVKMRNEQKFAEANALFEKLGDYRDSQLLIHKHNYVVFDREPPSCQIEGRWIYKCEGCDATYTETIPAEHTYSGATCMEPKKCIHCGVNTGKALGHFMVNGVCARCGVLFVKQTYSGYGAGYIDNISLPIGRYNICGKYSGNGNFIAKFFSNGDIYGELIANKIGSCTTKYTITSQLLNPIDNGYIDIRMADGSWSFTIEPVIE